MLQNTHYKNILQYITKIRFIDNLRANLNTIPKHFYKILEY